MGTLKIIICTYYYFIDENCHLPEQNGHKSSR